MRKKSKLFIFLLSFEVILFLMSLMMYLLDTTSKKYLTTFIVSSVLLVVLLICAVLVFIMESRQLLDFSFNQYDLKVVNRDHYQDLRKLCDKKELENSSEEVELLKKYEEQAVDYERNGNYYLVFDDNNPVALIKLNRDFKNKTILFDDIVLKTNDIEKIHEEIAKKDKKTIKN